MGPGLGPDDCPVEEKTLYLDLPSDMPGKYQKKIVSVDRRKMCRHPSDDSELNTYLVLDSCMNKNIPPLHPTGEDMRESGKPVGLEKTTGHQMVRGPDDKILVAVTYKTHRKGMSSITWEREIDLKKRFGYWILTPREANCVNSKYRAMRRAQAYTAYWRPRDKH